MSSWSSLDFIRKQIQYELEEAFRMHMDQTMGILNAKIVTDDTGNCIDLQDILVAAIKRSSEFLEAHTNNAFIFLTNNMIGPVLATKYKMEVREMQYNYLSLWDEVQSFRCGGIIDNSAVKAFYFNGLGNALSVTLVNGFRETLVGSRRKLVTLIIYQTRLSFGKAMVEYSNNIIQFVGNKVSNLDPYIIGLINCQATILFSNMENIVNIRTFNYVKGCIDEALEEYLKPLPTGEFVQFSCIDEMLNIGDFQGAFQIALDAANIYHLNYVCQRVDPSNIFQGYNCLLPYDVLLSLIQQLGVSLCINTYVKIGYLKMALPCLDVQDLISREYIPYVIKSIPMHLEHLVTKHPLVFDQYDLIQLLNYVKSIFIKCSS